MKLKTYLIFIFIHFLLNQYNLYSFNDDKNIEKALQLQQQHQYFRATGIYQKILKKQPENIDALKGLILCYIKTGNYHEALPKLQTLIKLTDDKEWKFRYAQILKITGNLTEAKNQLNLILQKYPGDLMTELFLRRLNEMEKWDIDPQWFTIHYDEWINSIYHDYAPVMIDNSIFFVSNRPFDLIEYLKDPNGKFYYSHIFRQVKSKKKIKPLKGEINGLWHTGPMIYAPATKKIIFSKISLDIKNQQRVYKPQLYEGELSKGRIDNIRPLPFINGEYSFTHPALSKDGKMLVFSSDMPGGKGGMDLWYSVFENGQWSQPVNLGDSVNTQGDEVFPYLFENFLYFSSNGWPGAGGLDIFRSTIVNNKSWSTPINMRTPLNSKFDDFGICFINDSTGYFSSSRPGGLGFDDIYKFTFHGIQYTPYTDIQGIVEFYKLPVSGLKLQLLDVNENLLDSTTTNQEGYFSFSHVTPDVDYLIKINIDEGKLPKNKKDKNIYLLNTKKEKIAKGDEYKSGYFRFKALSPNQADKLPLLIEKDEDLLTVSVYGQVYKILPGDYNKKVDVLIEDQKGNILGKIKTDEKGKFVFENLPPDIKYKIKLMNEGEDLKVIITDEKGNILDRLKKLKDGTFEYVRLDPDQSFITLLNENDEVIKIKFKEKFVMSKIYYEYDSWEITPESAQILDKLAEILKKNENIKVTLGSHTDSRASDKYNLELSRKRADAAVKYLISKGVDPSRIKGIGYGESQPVNHCVNGVECSEEEHAKNRRTEIIIETIK